VCGEIGRNQMYAEVRALLMDREHPLLQGKIPVADTVLDEIIGGSKGMVHTEGAINRSQQHSGHRSVREFKVGVVAGKLADGRDLWENTTERKESQYR
jgi:hypothetical protein